MYKIYRYISPNGKSYIGQTCLSLDKRAGIDGVEYIKSCPKFANAIHKYGWEWFKKHREILKSDLTLQQANYWETYYIGYYDALDNGYNIAIGGSNALDSISPTRPIVGINCQNHQIRRFASVSEAARFVDGVNTAITQCLNKESRTSYGYIWLDEDEYQTLNEEDIQKLYQIVPNQYLKPCKSVVCIETGEEFSSIKEAALKYNVDSSWLSKACRGLAKTAGGKHWRFTNNVDK